MKTIVEPERKVPVILETDVAVAGGGPAGLAAAIAAARNGAEVVLVERYGHLGGMATGGGVILLISMGDSKRQTIGGIPQEMVDRLTSLEAVVYPPEEDRYKLSEELIEKWGPWAFLGPEGVMYNVCFEAEILKHLANEMVEEAGAKLFLHSWATNAVVEGDAIDGIVFESKSGRRAIRARVVIDATGDGDIAAAGGALFEKGQMEITLVHRIGNVDVDKALRFRRQSPERYRELMAKLKEMGFFFYGEEGWHRTVRDGVVWSDGPTFYGFDALNVEDLTRVEVEARRMIMMEIDFYRRNMPGFESAYLVDAAPQIGTRESRRIVGEYTLTEDNIKQQTNFDDVVASGYTGGFLVKENLPFGIPYRSLIPKEIDNLLVAGRCVSCTHEALNPVRLIPSCMSMGQAAGTAAALSVRNKIKPRDLDVSLLQKTLRKQGVNLG